MGVLRDCGSRMDSRRGTSGVAHGLASANLALAFAVELGAFAAFSVWGASSFDGALAVLAAVVAPMAAVALWGVFAAPRSSHRLRPAPRFGFQFVIFGLAVVALIAIDHPLAASIFGGAAAINAICGLALGQWEK